MTFNFAVPTPTGNLVVSIDSGQTTMIVGANGSGKTRLAAEIESNLGAAGHRIAAHRALGLNTEVPKISEAIALNGLRTGWPDSRATVPGNRQSSRWNGKKEVWLLNDFDFLVQALYAEQANTALKTHDAVRAGTLAGGVAPPTNLEKLTTVWHRLLPTRALVVTADTIQVRTPDGFVYSAGDMSDGERAIFYMLGQALVAAADSVLIVDEPELHVHPSIMSKLWDEIQAARPDCGFVFITHDLNFAAGRPGQKFVLREYKSTHQWVIEPVPEATGFDEALVTLILGSRKPVLFVEGADTSLDIALYRACFPDWTVIPRGSCEDVIHSVVTMRRNESLTRVTCAGLVDADDYSQEERALLNDKGIAVLPVSEIENLILLPQVSKAIAASEAYKDGELDAKLKGLKEDVYAAASSPKAVDDVIARYCRRRIDRLLKAIDLSDATTPDAIADEYAKRTAALDVTAIAKAARDRIETALSTDDLPGVLQAFDNKGALLAPAARHLKATKKDRFEEWLVRALNNGAVPELIVALRASLPAIGAR